MASWLTHLRVAERIKQRVTDIDFPYLLMGSIAPDSGVPDEDRRNYTPSKEVTHYKYQIDNSTANMDESVFFQKYLVPEKIMVRSDNTRSFLWGYYFHLITDKLWLEEYFRPLQKRYEEELENPDRDFIDFIREEMLFVDFEYIRENGTELIDSLRSFDGNISAFYEFDSYYIFECRDRIVDLYKGEPAYSDKGYKYLSPQSIEDFVAKAAERCINILVI